MKKYLLALVAASIASLASVALAGPSADSAGYDPLHIAEAKARAGRVRR